MGVLGMCHLNPVEDGVTADAILGRQPDGIFTRSAWGVGEMI